LSTATLATSLKRGTNILPKKCLFIEQFQIDIFTSINDLPEEWDAFAKINQPLYQSSVIGITEKAQLTDFGFYYALLKENKETIALLYFQTLIIRKEYYPDFSHLSFAAKNLYCIISAQNYNLLVNGHIFNTDIPGVIVKKQKLNGAVLTKVLEQLFAKVKRLSKSSIFIIKDAHPLLQEELVKIKSKYKPMPDDILMEMQIPATWQNIDNYIEVLGKKYAVRARKIVESTSHFVVEEFDQEKILANVAVLDNLYKNVMERSSFKMGVLNMKYFAALKAELKDDFIFKVWKLNHEIVGFTSYIILNNHIELHYIGIDYKINKSHHLYQCILQQGIKDAIGFGKGTLRLGRTAYEAKAIAGAKPIVKSNFFQISNPILKIGYRYSADYFIAENNTNWQVRNPFK
jgi:hypothetical protein